MSVSEIWERFKNRRTWGSEFDSLNVRQRNELAHDVGVSRADLDHLYAVGDRGADELERLMRALSLDMEQMEIANPGTVTRDMSVVCNSCAVVGRCRRELEAGSAAQNYREFCPNAMTFEALLETDATLAERDEPRRA